MQKSNRRDFLTGSLPAALIGSAAITTTTTALAGATDVSTSKRSEQQPPLKLGLMTYMLGAKWDVQALIDHCTKTKFEHVELRTTHAHGVEVALTRQERKEVGKRFADAGLKLSLASAFAYHWPDPGKLKQHIAGTKEYVLLARDIGALGIRVFPNALKGGPNMTEEQTLEQIGKSAAEVGRFGADHGVQIRLSNHGRGSNRVSVLRRILDHADCPHVYVNWNCDRTDLADPGLEAHFNSVKDRISNIHLHDLADGIYPYRQLFALLRQNGYAGYCDAEVKASEEPLVFMRYYRALFLALQNVI